MDPDSLKSSVSASSAVLSYHSRLGLSCRAQSPHFFRPQLPPVPELQFPVAKGADRDPLQMRDGVADGLAHLAHLTISPFSDCDLQKGTCALGFGLGRARGPTRPKECRDSSLT